MPDFNDRMREGMYLLHVNDDDRLSIEEIYASHLSTRRKEQILEELKDLDATGNIWDDDGSD